MGWPSHDFQGSDTPNWSKAKALAMVIAMQEQPELRYEDRIAQKQDIPRLKVKGCIMQKQVALAATTLVCSCTADDEWTARMSDTAEDCVANDTCVVLSVACEAPRKPVAMFWFCHSNSFLSQKRQCLMSGFQASYSLSSAVRAVSCVRNPKMQKMRMRSVIVMCLEWWIGIR